MGLAVTVIPAISHGGKGGNTPSGEPLDSVPVRCACSARTLRERVGVRVALPIVLSLLTLVPAHAQQEDRERAALRRMQQQNARLQQENAALQRDKADLDQKLKAAQDELAKLKGQAGKLTRTSKALTAAEKENADLTSRLDGAQAMLAQTTQKCQADIATLRSGLADTQAKLQRSEQDSALKVAQLEGALGDQATRAQGCEAKNLELFTVTEDLIRRYKENRGAWEKFLLSEPFTQLKSVQVESRLEEMRYRAQQAKVAAPGPTPTQ